jgi:hypothetical protein
LDYLTTHTSATFSNISAISWQPVLVVEEAGVTLLKIALNTISHKSTNNNHNFTYFGQFEIIFA